MNITTMREVNAMILQGYKGGMTIANKKYLSHGLNILFGDIMGISNGI